MEHHIVSTVSPLVVTCIEVDRICLRFSCARRLYLPVALGTARFQPAVRIRAVMTHRVPDRILYSKKPAHQPFAAGRVRGRRKLERCVRTDAVRSRVWQPSAWNLVYVCLTLQSTSHPIVQVYFLPCLPVQKRRLCVVCYQCEMLEVKGTKPRRPWMRGMLRSSAKRAAATNGLQKD